MKGNVKIQLFDKNGNLVSEKQKHNMVTNAIRDALTPLAFDDCAISKSATSSSNTSSADVKFQSLLPYEFFKWFGTICLMEKKLSDDADDYIATTDEGCVGLSRYNLGYSGTNPHYGSYNQIDSGWSEDGKTFNMIYDFPTTQANGTISSVALMPINASDMGCGFSDAENVGINAGMASVFGHSVESSYFDYFNSYFWAIPLFADYAKNELYFYTKDEVSYTPNKPNDYIGKANKLKIYKVGVPLLSKEFGKSFTLGRTQCTSDDFELVYEASVSNSLNATGSNYGAISYSDGKIYILASKSASWASNTTLDLAIVDTTNWSESHKTIKNTCGTSIYLSNISGTYQKTPIVSYNYMLVSASASNTVYRININDSTDIKQIVEKTNGTPLEFASGAVQNFRKVIEVNDLTIFANPSSGTTTIMNLKDGTYFDSVKYSDAGTHIYSNSSGWTYYYSMFYPIIGLKGSYMSLSFSASGTAQSTFISTVSIIAFLMFTTKMNLDEPVTKTPDLSMKVTYSLTFE